MSGITHNSVEAEAIIAELKERFTELEAENARLKKERDELDHEFGGEHRLYLTCKQELLAAQLQIKELRELMIRMRDKGDGEYWSHMNKALATPDATPELDALMRDAELWRRRVEMEAP